MLILQRNAFIPVAYAGAVATSCGIAVGLNTWTSHLRGYSPMMLSALKLVSRLHIAKKKTRVVAIIIITYRLCVQERAVRCCGDGWCAQCRAHARQWTEVNEKRYICFLFVTFFFLLFREGITISDEDGRELGKSPAAGAVGAKSSFGSVFCINKFVVSLCACFFIIYL